MENYIGTKLIQAEPAYKEIDLKHLPAKARDGYRVVYPDGYESWSPKDVFEKAYRITGDLPGINFLMASLYLYAGKYQSAYNHLSTALELEPELFEEYKDLFPEAIADKKIKKLINKIKPE